MSGWASGDYFAAAVDTLRHLRTIRPVHPSQIVFAEDIAAEEDGPRKTTKKLEKKVRFLRFFIGDFLTKNG